jgi:hypothetical protein
MFRAVGNKIAIDLQQIQIPLSSEAIFSKLIGMGFCEANTDIVAIAREYIGGKYKLGAKISEAPDFFDCSSFIKFVYGNFGICLPRYTVHQLEEGQDLPIKFVRAGDLIFKSGHKNFNPEKFGQEVGHVGMMTDNEKIIHCAKKRGVAEESLSEFLAQNHFRGARRIIRQNSHIRVFTIPNNLEVETSKDVEALLFRSLPKT